MTNGDPTGLTCFIIGPIGDRLGAPGTPARQNYEDAIQMWENVFEPACNGLGLTPVRADKISHTGDIPEQIFVYLRDADIVIADVTGGNSNVMYELGMRHTRDKITIQVGENGRLPFDITTIRTIQFRRTEAGLIDARNSLSEALETALGSGGGQVTATRVWQEIRKLDAAEIATAAAQSLTSDDPADIDDDTTPGLIDLMAIGESAIDDISSTLTEINSIIQEAGDISTRLSPSMTSATSFAKRLIVMREWVDLMNEPTSKLDEISGTYTGQVNDINVMIEVLLDEIRRDPSSLTSARQALENVGDLSDSAEDASVSITKMIHAIRKIRSSSSVVRATSKSFEHSLNRILSSNTVIASWRSHIEDLPGWSN